MPESKGEKTVVGTIGLFDEPDGLVRAAEEVAAAGYRHWDCHTPYPVHGLDAAMRLSHSPMPYVTLTAGFIGLAAAIALTGGLSVYHYPIRIGGKALFSWQAFVPIFFELFVLFAATATLIGVIVMCRLGRWHSALHDTGVMHAVTGSRFAIVIEGRDEKYDAEEARLLLEGAGCRDIRPLLEESEVAK